MKKLISVFVLIFLAFSLFSDDLSWITLGRNLDLEIDPASQFIQGYSELSFSNIVAVDRITLDLTPLKLSVV